MNLQWYPGHMTKAKRMMMEDIKLIDLVIELVDARIPLASRNPDIDEIAGSKARMILLNKADLASQEATAEWEEYFKKEGLAVVPLDCRSRLGINKIQGAIRSACAAKIERDKARGIMNRPIRAMVVGIPNVGKSTFINTICKRACTKTGDKPGVTKGKQWIKLDNKTELLDTPGILWPKFENEDIGRKLAFIGSINDDIIDSRSLACLLIDELDTASPNAIENRYEVAKGDTAFDTLCAIAGARGCLKKGGEIDDKKAADIVLDEFRSGKLGRISLERP